MRHWRLLREGGCDPLNRSQETCLSFRSHAESFDGRGCSVGTGSRLRRPCVPVHAHEGATRGDHL